MKHLNPHISAEIQQAIIAANLPPYQGGPGVDYNYADFAYAVNITLLHMPRAQKPHMPHAGTQTLLVQRGSGDDIIGSWSGVSGYIDTPHDPRDIYAPANFDPITYTVYTELAEECGFSSAVINALHLYLGERFTVPKYSGGILHVLPVVAVHTHNDVPKITPHPVEVSDYSWQRLDTIRNTQDLAPGYFERSLPHSLKALGLHDGTIDSIIRPQ